MIESHMKYQIDAMLLCETQVKWTALTLDRIESRLKLFITGASIKQWSINENEYLPGRTLSVFIEKSRSLIKENEIFQSTLGN